MKKSRYIIGISIFIAAITCLYLFDLSKNPVPEAETPNALVPSIIVDDILYTLDGGKLYIQVDEDDYLGYTISKVPLSEWPIENGQSNAVPVGTPYAAYASGLVMLWGEEWSLFNPQ